MKEGTKKKDLMLTLRSLKSEEMATRERDESEQAFWLRFKLQGKQVENTASVKIARRNLARLKTVRRETALKSQKGAVR